MNYLIFDTETTGINPNRAKIVTFGYVSFDETFTILDQNERVYNPEIPIEPGASKIHGIFNEQVKDKPIIESDKEFIINLFKKSDLHIAHNHSYDWTIITRMFPELLMQSYKSRCTMKSTTGLCRILNKWDKYKWPKLDELASFLKIENRRNSSNGVHGALLDCLVIFDCVKALKEQHNNYSII